MPEKNDEKYLYERLRRDLRNRIDENFDFNVIIERYRDTIRTLVNTLREMRSIETIMLNKINDELNSLYEKFKKYAIIINIIGAAPLGLGLVVSLPLTYVLYKTWYLPLRDSLLEKRRRAEKELEKARQRYNKLLDSIARDYLRSLGKEYIPPEKKVTTFRDVYELIIMNNLEMNTIKCPSCGTELELPLEGTYIKCPKCGYVVKAEDVYSAIKWKFKLE